MPRSILHSHLTEHGAGSPIPGQYILRVNINGHMPGGLTGMVMFA